MASVTFSGITATVAAMEALKRRLQDAGREAGSEQSGKILSAAQANAPIKTGELRASGKVEERGRGLFRVSFDADHAAAVHQRHPTQGKFLERAMKDNRTEQGYANKMRTKLR